MAHPPGARPNLGGVIGDRIEAEFEHEQLHVFRDPETKLTGAVAIHSTVLGPAMGGLRLFRYPDLTDGLVDVLRLARAMSLKSSAAGLDLGGGKAILLDDGLWDELRVERMRAFGAVVESLGGRYVTAEDVGTTPADMDEIATVSRHVAGGPVERGGRGDPAPFTARTVFGAIECAARMRLGRDDLDGVRVGVQGVGHVGSELTRRLLAVGARVFVADIDPDRAQAVAAGSGAEAVPLAGFAGGDFDVFAPCALGGAIGPDEVATLRARVVAGAANNPLADRGLAVALLQRDVLYVPDFLANCGGIIHVGAEVLGLDDAGVERLLVAATERTERLLAEAAAAGESPLEVAERFAWSRLNGAG